MLGDNGTGATVNLDIPEGYFGTQSYGTPTPYVDSPGYLLSSDTGGTGGFLNTGITPAAVGVGGLAALAAGLFEAPLLLALGIGAGVATIWNHPPAEFTNDVNAVDQGISNVYGEIKSGVQSGSGMLVMALLIGGIYLVNEADQR